MFFSFLNFRLFSFEGLGQVERHGGLVTARLIMMNDVGEAVTGRGEFWEIEYGDECLGFEGKGEGGGVSGLFICGDEKEKSEMYGYTSEGVTKAI